MKIILYSVKGNIFLSNLIGEVCTQLVIRLQLQLSLTGSSISSPIFVTAEEITLILPMMDSIYENLLLCFTSGTKVKAQLIMLADNLRSSIKQQLTE